MNEFPEHELVKVRGDKIIGDPVIIRPGETFKVTFTRPPEKKDSELVGKRVRVPLDSGMPHAGWTVEAHRPPLVYLSGNGYPENGKLLATNEAWIELDPYTEQEKVLLSDCELCKHSLLEHALGDGGFCMKCGCGKHKDKP